MDKNWMNLNLSRSKNPRVKFRYKKKCWRFSRLVCLLGVFPPFKFMCVWGGISKVTANEAGRWWSLMNGFCSPKVVHVRSPEAYELQYHLLNIMPGCFGKAFPVIPRYSNGHRRSTKSGSGGGRILLTTFYPPHPQAEPTNVPMCWIPLGSFSFKYKQNTLWMAINLF